MIEHDERTISTLTYYDNIVCVVLSDGTTKQATFQQLHVPTDKALDDVLVDEFCQGIEFHFTDGTMHDVCGDVIKALP